MYLKANERKSLQDTKDVEENCRCEHFISVFFEW